MKILFVYNADGTFGAVVKDVVKKAVSADSQECNLCKVTYPLFAMDKTWRDFVSSLPHEVIFLHRDEFHKQYPHQQNIPLPAVFAEESNTFRALISRDELNSIKNVEELISLVQSVLRLGDTHNT